MKTRNSTQNHKPVFGTREWNDYSENFISGCSHDCRYCYAKAREVLYKRKTPQTWKLEEVNEAKLSRRFKQLDGKIMFPTSHDITPPHLQECMDFMEHMLIPGNELLVVSKPHLDCIKAICARFTDYKDKILFRFTIGSTDRSTLRFWEPNAPDFQERLESLKYAFECGFKTSVSCESMLDNNMDDLIGLTAPFVTDSIWLGKANMLMNRLQMNRENAPTTIAEAIRLMRIQTHAYIWGLYFRYKDNPKVKWKESIKKIVGLEIATEQRGKISINQLSNNCSIGRKTIMPKPFREVTVQPQIPAALVKKGELQVLKKFFFHQEVDQNGDKELYFFSHKYSGIAFDAAAEEISQDHMIKVFQKIIKRSKGRLEYVYLHAGDTCGEMEPDAFGGWVIFNRENSVETFSTWQAIERFKEAKESCDRRETKGFTPRS